MLRKNTTSLILFIALAVPGFAVAQTSDTEELDIIEMEIDREAPKPATTNNDRSSSTSSGFQDAARDNTLSDFSGLGGLAAFKDVSVIQKRYLPKTGRFQLFGGATIVTNNPFFTTYGGVAKASYYLTEQWGVELNYFGLTTSTRQLTEDLKDKHSVKTESLVYSKSYVGLDLQYIPIYGKMAWFNEKIIPFDLYFAAGYGTTALQSGENAGTVHLAAGQIFAISKAYAVRWDFSWNFFSAKTLDPTTNSYSTSSFNNLFLTVGMSWFFPEANYR